jgi:hypothetical protein
MNFTIVRRVMVVIALFAISAFAQETTGGLQGTVKDPSGAVVSHAQVVLTGTSLVGTKQLETDGNGYYRFANLPPGTYSMTLTAKGFNSVKRAGLNIEVGHVPTVDITLEVGTSATVIEVTGQAPVIDVTTNTNLTNLTSETLANAPHGYSFQSVIQFAPMARNEPLAGGSAGAGTAGAGGLLPGSSGNGQNVGYTVGGGADSENQYLVEGQDTENISGGVSAANVPFQFIQEMQVKSSGIEAEHGGALGGVVNVVMKKGGNAFHGSLFASWEGDALDGSWSRNYGMFPSPPVAGLGYDPLAPATSPAPASVPLEPDAITYIPKKDHFRIVQPGFTLGGPIVKDRLWFFLGYAPQYNANRRTVNFGPALCASIGGCPNSSLGNQIFERDLQQNFTTARLDATLTQKVRVFGSWLYQYARESGADLPNPDPIAAQSSFLNSSIFTPLSQYSHGLGFAAPNANYNVGADITLTPKIISTTRFGYFFQNYHDFGWPTTGLDVVWNNSGLPPALDNKGLLLPPDLRQPAGTSTAPYNAAFTEVNASKHWQFNEDVAFFKSGWLGTHNLKVGYQFNRLWNIINQHGNLPQATLFPGNGQSYQPGTAFGGGNCGSVADPTAKPPVPASGLAGEWGGNCAGQYGYLFMQGDFATVLKDTSGHYAPAIDNNHAFFVQDAWTVGHGLTLNLGVRIEKETLPRPAGVGIANIRTIDFSWSDKIEPRLGAAWGSANGKLKIFGSYGVINDVMKLLLAQTSFGAQGWDECAYPLGPNASGTFNLSDISTIVYNASGRACPTGPPNTGAVFSNGVTPASLIDTATSTGLIENLNLRPEEPIAPGLKPYRQHEYVGGADYQISKDWALEVRYDRRRLDHAIEDASLSAPCCIEFYAIVNPGQGVNKDINQYAAFLRSLGAGYGPGVQPFDPTNQFGTCSSCPPMPQAVRNYDGLEFRLTKNMSHNWSGSFSYTWSSLWGNYAGLTTTDQSDGGVTGRNSPDTSRAFDEPIYYFAANGKSSNGPLATDRPSALKGNLYYTLPWWSKSHTTTFGLFQTAYQGSPVGAFDDIGLAGGSPFEGTYVFGRGKWANVTADPTTDRITSIGAPYARRTPWYTQTDLNIAHEIKVNHNNEAQRLRLEATFTNLLNQHSVLGYWEGFDSNHFPHSLHPPGPCGPGGATAPCGIASGAGFYQGAMTGYDVQAVATSNQFLNSLYGQPNLWQTSRAIRFGATFTF